MRARLTHLALGCVRHYLCLSGFAEEGEEDLELAGGEAFLGGAVAGGAESVEEAWGEIDFAGEEAARGFLATAIKIGHGKVLLELVMHRFEIFC